MRREIEAYFPAASWTWWNFSFHRKMLECIEIFVFFIFIIMIYIFVFRRYHLFCSTQMWSGFSFSFTCRRMLRCTLLVASFLWFFLSSLFVFFPPASGRRRRRRRSQEIWHFVSSPRIRLLATASLYLFRRHFVLLLFSYTPSSIRFDSLCWINSRINLSISYLAMMILHSGYFIRIYLESKNEIMGKLPKIMPEIICLFV